MKEEKKMVYTCVFCGKYYISKHHAKTHEDFCKKNPNNQHACFDFCTHLKRNSILTEDGHITYFTCEAKDGKKMFSYKAEKFIKLYPSINNLDISGAERMPLTCELFKES